MYMIMRVCVSRFDKYANGTWSSDVLPSVMLLISQQQFLMFDLCLNCK